MDKTQIVTLRFPSQKPRGRNGMTLPEGCDIPIEKPCKDNEIIGYLESALSDLSDIPCAFWACEGPTQPKHMVTCTKCWAMVDIAKAIAALKAKHIRVHTS